MKTTIAILGILLGLTFQAQARTVQSEELGKYKRAALISLSGKSLGSCQSVAQYAVHTITDASSLELSENGQPLLTFSTYDEYKRNFFQVVMTTDSSFKNILSIKFLTFKRTSVNDGTLKDPNIQERYIVEFENSVDCTK